MENKELNQNSVLTDIVETEGKSGKTCKTCNSSKTLTKNNIGLIVVGFSTVFLMFYGLISLVKDISQWFTR
jgi:hypothetical protein